MAAQYKWVPLLIASYIFYAWVFVCPPTQLNPNLNKLSPINCHFCKVSDAVVKPCVQPVYEQHVRPVILTLEEKYQLCHQWDEQVVKRVYDSKYGNAVLSQLSAESHKAVAWFEGTVEPFFQDLLASFILRIRYVAGAIVVNVNYAVEPVVKVARDGLVWIKSLPVIQQACERVEEVFAKLMSSSHAVRIQERSSFLKAEFKNLVKFDEFHPREFKSSLINVVKEMLGQKSKDGDWPDVIVGGDDDDDDVETIVIVSTISVTQVAVATDDIDPSLKAVLDEINFWEKRVEKSIELAKKNLEQEITPKLQAVIEKIKPEISTLFQELQKENHLQYKELNQKISEINRDEEKIRESNDTTIETVTRQEIRDDIAAAHKSAEDCSLKVQDILSTEHEQVLNEYFKSIQDTIDVLETFSESTINEFSQKLHQLTSALEVEQDEESIHWKIWKKFHQIKERLFEFRDDIYDKAHQYKKDNKKFASLVIGLEPWNEYLSQIEFHINYLVRDNADYLRLVRAKANLAFQGREELVHNLSAGV
ncbi:uncharacterized protein LODBEIA_P14570 [Lodderomyces beijingensis]|uniref:Uncharacterized protein n=1 Tax=Lodderomyces beijingensis TaxID=1775926 RepID=A0ABP0ZHX9_9ASCO